MERSPDSRVAITAYTCDGHGRLVAVAGPRGGVTRGVHDEACHRIRVTDPDGRVTHVSGPFPAGAVVAHTRDSAGRRS